MSTTVLNSRPAGSAVSGPALIECLPANYLVVDGSGPPGGARFRHAMKGLYSVAYTLKMQLKLEGADFRIGPLQALWWPNGPGPSRWQLLLPVPEAIDGPLVKLARDTVAAKRRVIEAADVRLERIAEGACVEAIHIGSYSHVGETVGLIHAYMVESKLAAAGPLHEIYLSDPRLTRPERLRTLVRQPVR